MHPRLLENNLRRQISRPSIDTVVIGETVLVIWTQNKAEVSICGVEIYIYIYIYIYRFLLDHRKILLTVNCGVKIVILCRLYLAIEPHARVVYCQLYMYLKHTLPVPDFRPKSIHIPFYTNVRILCSYYDM